MASRVQSFAPLERASAHTLILGTMPGAASLEAREYYAHPRNLFWTIIGALLGFSRDAPYAARVSHVVAADIAVWDVLKSCERPGSLDASIAPRSVVANDFERFFANHPRVDRVFFNGAAAAALYRRHVLPALAERTTIHYTRLPSTSPANAGIPATAKEHAWQVLLGRTGGLVLQRYTADV